MEHLPKLVVKEALRLLSRDLKQKQERVRWIVEEDPWQSLHRVQKLVVLKKPKQ